MPETRPDDSHVPQIAADTRAALRDLVHDAVLRLAKAQAELPPEWDTASDWSRGRDGNLREIKKRIRILRPMAAGEWHRLPAYDKCTQALKADEIIGPHLDRLVGTSISASRIEVDDILQSVIYRMVDHEGNFEFTDDRLADMWGKLAEFFVATHIPWTMVAPLPRLKVPTLPLRLNDEIVLDRLTDDEVTRCCACGVLRPDAPQLPLIYADMAVGIRFTRRLPKVIRVDGETISLPRESEGRFGSRPILREDLVVDDVLSALRILKHGRVRATGYATWTDSPLFLGGLSFRVLGQWPYGGDYDLAESEVPELRELWQLLVSAGRRFGFSIHRFSRAFDRGLLVDRIVDLVIAAESLFLGDSGAKDRGELRFRFALRAAKFIEDLPYDELETFRVMRRAYDVRSTVVHGGVPDDTRLPDNDSATLQIFTDAIEELVRLALRKALSMNESGDRLRQSAYWDSLVLSGPGSSGLPPVVGA